MLKQLKPFLGHILEETVYLLNESKNISYSGLIIIWCGIL